ncbi:lysophospholipid acyltransferase family protein [soil metagenome]
MILRIFVWFFKRRGWKAEGKGIPPHVKKAVIIAMPHSSNWDFVYAMAAIKIFGIKLNYLAKKELFRWPIKKLFLNTGGIPVERAKNTRMVDSMIQKFRELERLILIIPAEGTRIRVDKIKSGFYHVALEAGVPLCMAYLDYKTKTAGFSEPFFPTGNKEADATVIRNFYKGKEGKFPNDFNLEGIRLD